MKNINRRKFLHNSTLITTGFLSLPILSMGEIQNPLTLNYTEVKGRIHSNGKGIANVVITDGKLIYLSDKSGKFEFPTDRPFVYFSYPSGYKFNLLPNGSVDFFRKLDFGKKINTLDFNLQKNNFPETKHHFITIADPQIQTKEEAETFISESCTDIRNTVSEINDPNTFGIGLGDLVFDEFDLFEYYNQGIKSTGIPFFQVLGNHDIDLLARSNSASQYPFTDQYGPSHYSFNRGNRHYVVLNDVFFLGNKQYYGYLDEEQLQWLEKDLSFIEKGSEIVLFLHIPPQSKVAILNQGRDLNKESVINNGALYEILKDYKAHIISGHVHWNENIFHKNIYEHNTASISGAWWAADICYDGTPKGYSVYQNNSKLSWYYKSIGADKNLQFRAYAPGSHPDFPEDYCLNIWNWDPECKITWKENGKISNSIRKVETYDPLAISTFNNRDKGAKHPWITAQRNSHLFFFQAQSDNSEIEVEVIDRFGNTYKQILSRQQNIR